eukprot:TRINITY_DN5319_c0_g1_i9.p1 TRINITY_DN5319_c0_g1~~TRINITY_DN5319_c0_g1_i9.p1  ORF type:complete len:322 (+),score=54.56 TRINITY_DN5319_c0_g1_i9:667-1632(+)
MTMRSKNWRKCLVCGNPSVLYATSLDDMWKEKVRFGRIDAKKETRLLSKLPFEIKKYPSIFSCTSYNHVEFHNTTSFNVEAIDEMIRNVLRRNLKKLNASEINKFLLRKDSSIDDKFNVVMIGKREDIPDEFMSSAMDNGRIANFAYAERQDMNELIHSLKAEQSTKLVVTYSEYSAKDKSIPAIETSNATEIGKALHTIVQHSLIEITQNNFNKYCRGSSQITQGTICILALIREVAGEDDHIFNFRNQVHKSFKEQFRAAQNKNSPFQYGIVKLSEHAEVKQLLKRTPFKLDDSSLNYIVTYPDGSFAVSSARNRTLTF